MAIKSATDSIPAKYRNPVIHDRSPSNYPGDFQITDKALKAYGISRELFGTTEVLNPDGSSFRVKDCQYVLEDGSVGMTFIPVNDAGAVEGADGHTIYGSVLVDQLLRDKMGLKHDDQIYALLYYIHPELNKGSVLDFVTKLTDKLELGITHMSAYTGGGRTTNSPPLYHNRVWGVKGEVYNDFGYPANLMILSLRGVDQATLNKNLALTDNILNNGVRFPLDYKTSQFRPVHINTALMFYRDWVLEEQYLRSDTSWFTYCAAHKSLVANVGLNLPHNLNSFKEVYGETEGAEFFQQFSDLYFEVFGDEFTEDHQTHFEPLWKQQGLTAQQIRPLTLKEYEAWDAALMKGQLEHFVGKKPLDPAIGTPWGPQMTADIIYDFVQMYADFVDAGAIMTAATVYGFATPVIERTGISKFEYLYGAIPIAQHAMEAHARMYAAKDSARSYKESIYYKQTFQSLYTALGGKDKGIDVNKDHSEHFGALGLELLGLIKGLEANLLPELLTWVSLIRVRHNWDNIMSGELIPLDEAYVKFMDSIQNNLIKAREMVVSNPKGIQFNTPPAIGHMIVTGMFPCNELVSLRPIVTVVNYTELERKQPDQ